MSDVVKQKPDSQGSNSMMSAYVEKVGQLQKVLLSGQPAKKVQRGVEAVIDEGEHYSPDPVEWPKSIDGKIIPQICWGGLRVPLDKANLHFLIAGVPGTGKTLAIRSLLQSIFSSELRAVIGGVDRGIVYDPKQEFYPVLRAIGCSENQLVILNPFDSRGHAWNLAEDYTTMSDALQLARTIVPVADNHAQPFFPKSAAGVLAAVLRVYMVSMPGRWDLLNILRACLDGENILKVLANAPPDPIAMMAVNFLKEQSTRNNVMAELCSHIMDYLPAASCWRRAAQEGDRSISIRSFIESRDTVILLGANQTHRVALHAINKLFLKKLSEATLDHVADGQWQAQNRTWLILDELREMGKIDGLGDLINKGRSRGVCTVLGFQDYPGLKMAFGDNVAHEIAATCAHKLFMRLGGDSAEWASKVIGKSEIRETQFNLTSGMSFGFSKGKTAGTNWGTGESSGYMSHTRSHNSGGMEQTNSNENINFQNSVSSNTTIRETDAVLPSEIAHLPGFAEGGGLQGFVCRNAALDGPAKVSRIFVPAPMLLRLKTDETIPGYKPRPASHQEFPE